VKVKYVERRKGGKEIKNKKKKKKQIGLAV
jgi:hypothetical protein